MTRKFFFICLVLLTGFSCFAFLNFYEQNHVGLNSMAITKKWEQAMPDHSLLRTGDLIFRHGRGVISNMMMACSRRDAKYSHAGIISVEHDGVFVYHAIGGEENRTNKLRKDPLDVFCNPDNVHSFGIYRLDLNEHQITMVDSLAENYFRHGLEFDTKFDLDSDDRMYCSEFVYKIITQVTHTKNYITLSTISGMRYVACDDLYLNAHSRFIYSFNY